MRRSPIAFVAAMVSVAALTGCGGSPGATTNSATPKVTLLLAVQGCSFCLAVQQGAEDAAAESGVELTTMAPRTTDAAAQVQMLNSISATNPDGLVLQPIDPSALLGTLGQLADDGVAVMTVDTDVADPSARLGVITSDNRAGGEVAAQHVADLIGAGKVGFIGYTPGVPAMDDRQIGFEAGLAAFEGIEFVGAEYTADDQSMAAAKISALVRREPQLKAIFAADEANAIGAVAGLTDAGVTGDVRLVAFDGAPSQVSALRNGTIDALVVQRAYDMGYSAIEQLSAHLEDGTAPAPETLLDYVVVTRDNVDDAEVQPYLYPQP